MSGIISSLQITLAVLLILACLLTTSNAQHDEAENNERSTLETIGSMQNSFLDGSAIDDTIRGFKDAYGFLTQSEAHLKEAHLDHLQRGALRSGQGLSNQAYERIRLLEESERLIEIEEN